MQRLAFFDGVRGLACLQVVAFHYVLCFFPAGPFIFPDNGIFAVDLFFLMSGFVLTQKFSRAPGQIVAQARTRLVRLLVPAWVALVIATLILGADHTLAHFAAGVAGSAEMWGYTMPPTWSSSWHDLGGASLFFGFADHRLVALPGLINLHNSADPVIWTIGYEIWGSFWVMALVWLRAVAKPAYRLVVLTSLAWLWPDPSIGINPLCLFTLGHVAAGEIAHQVFGAPRPKLVLVWFGGAMILVGALLCGGGWLRLELCAVLVFFGVLISRPLHSVLGHPLLQRLGLLSFSIYLVHWPIMMAVGSMIFLTVRPLGQALATLCAFCAGLAVTFAVADTFERYIDAPAIALSHRIGSTTAFRSFPWRGRPAGLEGVRRVPD